MGSEERAFAAERRKQPQWVISRSLKSVGSNATLVGDDLEGAMRALKAEREGDVEVAGSNLAPSLTELGLIDVYRSTCTVVLGRGKLYFASARPRRRVVASDRIDEDSIRIDLRSWVIWGPALGSDP